MGDTSDTGGLLLLKHGTVVFSSPELAGKVCDCAHTANCCGRWNDLKRAATACETGAADAIGSASVVLSEGGRRQRVDFLLRKTVVDASVVVVATVNNNTSANGRDPLTSLANRTTLNERLASSLSRLEQPVGVLMIDLDNFKMVNDTAGHATGDRLLSLVGQRLEGCVRSTDIAARLGGDEFVVLLHDVKDEREVRGFANRMGDVIARPYVIGGQRFVVGCSVGGAMAPRDGVTAEQLLRRADAAMYLAKRTGRNRFLSWSDLVHLGHHDELVTIERPSSVPRLGVHLLDRAHDGLASLTSQSIELALRPGGLTRGDWRKPLESLLIQSRQHFSEEEGFMSGRSTDTEHQHAHELFLAAVETTLGERNPQAAALVALSDKLIDHIATYDASLAANDDGLERTG